MANGNRFTITNTDSMSTEKYDKATITPLTLKKRNRQITSQYSDEEDTTSANKTDITYDDASALITSQ
jgi:hypothetical protein